MSAINTLMTPKDNQTGAQALDAAVKKMIDTSGLDPESKLGKFFAMNLKVALQGELTFRDIAYMDHYQVDQDATPFTSGRK